MKVIRRFFITLCLMTAIFQSNAAPAEKLIKIIVSPNHDNWLYNTGEDVLFNVQVFKNHVLMKGADISYAISEDMMKPRKSGNKILSDGTFKINGGTMKKPGFLRCSITVKYDGVEYKEAATAGFDPEKLTPTVTEPNDFISFWTKAIEERNEIPLDFKMRLIPERCTSKVNVYHVSSQTNKQGGRVYGILSIPNDNTKKYPAFLRVPGAGIYASAGETALAENGVITLEIGIHGIPANMSSEVYNSLINGALNKYYAINLDDKDKYYFKRVYLDCIRAVDMIYSLPQFDGENIVVYGSSQGGALSIVTAALDKRIKGLVAYYPGLCDISGYLYGRAGSWPHILNDPKYATPEVIETFRYYDVANFSRHITVPGYFSFGYNDTTCPPTTVYSALNMINAPKTYDIIPEIGHYMFTEQKKKADEWALKQLNVIKK